MPSSEHRDWNLTGEAFERLLGRLEADRDAAAREYERLRRRLADFFDWRGSTCPEAHADETLDRVARKLEQGEAIERIPNYAFGVARWVLLEWRKRHSWEEAAREALRWTQSARQPAADAEERTACMERCLTELPEESRALIVTYYKEAAASPLKGRKRLAERLGVSYVALKTRVHRTRGQLEECLRDCLGSPGRSR